MSDDRDDARLDGLELDGGRFSFSSTGGLVWMSHGHFTGVLRSDTAIDKAFLAALHALADARERIAELVAEIRAVHEGGVFTAGETSASYIPNAIRARNEKGRDDG